MLFVRIAHAIDCLQFLEQIFIRQASAFEETQKRRLTVICHGCIQAIKTEGKYIRMSEGKGGGGRVEGGYLVDTILSTSVERLNRRNNKFVLSSRFLIELSVEVTLYRS